MTTSPASALSVDVESSPAIGAGPGPALRRFVSHAFRLRGRASRSEYWWWMLVNVVVVSSLEFLLPWLIEDRLPRPALMLGPFGPWLFADIPLYSVSPTTPTETPIVAAMLLAVGIWALLTLVPGYTVAVRRLHDSNLSGWWALLVLLPVGPYILLLLATRRSRPEGVRFD